MAAETAELVHAAEGPHGGVVLDDHVPGQRGGVAEDEVVAQDTVVGDVHVGHQQVVVPDLSERPAARGAAVDGDELADAVVVADDDLAVLATELQVLRDEPQAGEGKDAVAAADADGAFDDGVGADFGLFADLDLGADHSVRPDAHARGQARLRINDSRGMNAHSGRVPPLPARARSRSTTVASSSASATRRSPT